MASIGMTPGPGPMPNPNYVQGLEPGRTYSPGWIQSEHYPLRPDFIGSQPTLQLEAPSGQNLPSYFLAQAQAGPAENEGQAATTAAPAGSSNANAQDGDPAIGPKPPEDVTRSLLRFTSVLLKPGAFQTEIGALYTREQSRAVVMLRNDIPTLERLSRRRFVVPFSLRYGWSKDKELFAAVPFGLSLFERDNPVTETSDQVGVLGDITLGLIKQLDTCHDDLPEMTLTYSVAAPTGPPSFRSPTGNVAALGNGFWRPGITLNLVKSYDPVVMFSGVGYQYQFSRSFDGLYVEPGHVFTYYAGLGLAVSDDISLSAQLNGAWESATSINGITIPSSDIEPISLRMGVMRRISLKDRIQVFVQSGLTDNASDALFGILLIHDE